LTLFGIGEGRGPFAFASREGAGERLGGAAAGGFALSLGSPERNLEALAAVSFPKSPAPISGWKPDPYAAPALAPSELGGPLGNAALVAERGSAESGALVALSASYGESAGSSGALRLQAREERGALGLRLLAAAAAPGYRALFGRPQERLLGAAGELRIAMRRSSSLSLGFEAEAEGRGLRYAPLWGRSERLELALPLHAERPRFLEAGLEARRSAEGERSGTARLAVEGGKVEEGGSATAGASLGWERRFDGIGLSLSTKLAARGGLPRVDLDLGLGLFDGARADSPVMAKAGFCLALPCGETGSLALDLDLPEGGIELAPRAGGSGAKAADPVLRLRYKASFGSSTRRPRSRSPTGPKASSIAQRAAS
jgi:hypothetical protein